MAVKSMVLNKQIQELILILLFTICTLSHLIFTINLLGMYYYYYYYFTFGFIGSSLLHMGFLQLQQAGATPRCDAWVSHCCAFSCCRVWALGVWASVVVARRPSSCGSWALECRLSSCGARAQLLRGMWDLPRPGIESMSPALAGRFSTTAPPGKPRNVLFIPTLTDEEIEHQRCLATCPMSGSKQAARMEFIPRFHSRAYNPPI